MMQRAALALVVASLAVTAAPARVAVQNIQAAHGALLPERKSLEYFPQEMVFFRYTVVDAKVDAEGQVDVEASIKLTDATGKEVAANKLPLKGALSLGGDTFFASAYVVLPEDLVPGKYRLAVVLTDRLSGDKIDFDREIVVKQVDFAALFPRFSYDPEGRVAAPAGGLVNQTLHFRLPVVGLDKGREKVELVSSVQVLDAKGKELLPKPLETVIKETDPKVIKATSVATFNGSLGLHRPGSFTLRITVTDREARKSSTLEVPFKVEAP
jgi:hypothetical protein